MEGHAALYLIPQLEGVADAEIATSLRDLGDGAFSTSLRLRPLWRLTTPKQPGIIAFSGVFSYLQNLSLRILLVLE